MIPFRDDNPHTSFPFFTIILIAINTVVFLFEVTLSQKQGLLFISTFGMIPKIISHPGLIPEFPFDPKWTFLTSLFLHGGWLHLIGNMLYLWIFGDNVEHAMGRIKFLIFYIGMGLIAGLTHYYFNSDSRLPTVGASGAIAGVLGAYLNLYPHARIHTLVFFGFFSRVIYLPAVYALGFWFVFQLLEAAMTPRGIGGVAYGAHIGGFVAGYLLVRPFCKPRYRRFKR